MYIDLRCRAGSRSALDDLSTDRHDTNSRVDDDITGAHYKQH